MNGLKKQVNIGHVITMIGISLSMIIIPLIVWGVNVEKVHQKHSDKIEAIEQKAEKNDQRMEFLFQQVNTKLDKVFDKVMNLSIDLQNKQNRKE